MNMELSILILILGAVLATDLVGIILFFNFINSSTMIKRYNDDTDKI